VIDASVWKESNTLHAYSSNVAPANLDAALVLTTSARAEVSCGSALNARIVHDPPDSRDRGGEDLGIRFRIARIYEAADVDDAFHGQHGELRAEIRM
jgi:hypothetical protein